MCLLTFTTQRKKCSRYTWNTFLRLPHIDKKVWKSADYFLGQHYKVALLHRTSITKTH